MSGEDWVVILDDAPGIEVVLTEDPASLIILEDAGATDVVTLSEPDSQLIIQQPAQATVVEQESLQEVVLLSSAGLPGPPGPAGPPGGAVDLMAHVLDPMPHPAYDDIPDLSLQFNNGLV